MQGDDRLRAVLELARRNQDNAKIATTLNNLGILDGDQNRPEAARKGFEEALKIYHQLAQENPDTYLPNVALTLNNLANLDRDQNRPEAARKGYEERSRFIADWFKNTQISTCPTSQ